MQKKYINMINRIVSVSNNAWSKLRVLSVQNMNKDYVLNVTSNKSRGIYFDIVCLDNHNLKFEPKINLAKIDNYAANLYIDPIIIRLVKDINIDYQTIDIKNNIYEESFIYNINYFDSKKNILNTYDNNMPTFIEYLQNDNIYNSFYNMSKDDYKKYYGHLNFNYKKLK